MKGPAIIMVASKNYEQFIAIIVILCVQPGPVKISINSRNKTCGHTYKIAYL